MKQRLRERLRFKTLAGRYAAGVAGIAIAVLSVSGVMEMYFSFVDSREQISRAQTVQARAAASEIEQHLAGMRAGLKGVTQLPWSRPDFDLARRREEFYRLMVLFPGIIELRLVGSRGTEQLTISRMVADRLKSAMPVSLTASQQSLKPGAAAYGDVYFDRAQPLVTLAMAGQHEDGLITLATLDLRFLSAVISDLKVDGSVLITDRADMLIAHSRATNVMRHLDLSQSPLVRAVRDTTHAESAALAQGVAGVDLDGQPVIGTAVRIASPDWLLLIERPRSEALRPALDTLARTVGLLAIATLVAIAASLVFARRLAAPIVRMRRATERIASGDFASRVAPIDSGDEVARLGQDFNRMATALETSYAELELRIEARTQELRDARDAAERASSAKTRFLAAASHDLRQPMHTIGLLATVLRNRTMRDEEWHRLADKLQACTAVMEGLFASLLDISKLDAGVVKPRPETFAINDLLERVCSHFEPQATQKGIRLRMHPTRAIVRSDPGMLERILMNLVSNAVRYTHEGSVLIGCRRRGEWIAVQVIDSGPGIAPSSLTHIFEEFVRLDTETSSADDKGLGLGLSIVERSARVLGHEIQVRSTLGRGSCFEVVIPRLGELAMRELADGRPAGQALTSAPLAGIFLLVIDDDDGNRQGLEAMCLQWGGSVLACPSARAASSELAQHLRTPDLLVTDLRLGGGEDGFSALRVMREVCGEELPALIVTADVDAASAAEAARIGVPLLHKPVAASRLLETLIHLLHEALGDKQSPGPSADERGTPDNDSDALLAPRGGVDAAMQVARGAGDRDLGEP